LRQITLNLKRDQGFFKAEQCIEVLLAVEVVLGLDHVLVQGSVLIY
jgi:hypothetical protein